MNAIKNGRFNWKKYTNGGLYFGQEISTMPLFCSYGQIGFTVTVGNTEIKHDWEFNETKIINI